MFSLILTTLPINRKDAEMPDTLYKYAIIGTGIPHEHPGPKGFGMANTHWPSFNSTGKVELVAIADVIPEHSASFLQRHGQQAREYVDFEMLLQRENVDIVSICTWPHLHAPISIACAKAGVKVIHCEKPMAITWDDAKAMKQAADEAGALMSFGHQRRFIKLFQHVRALIESGAIGSLVQIEAHCPNLYDWGCHWLDMLQFYNGDSDVEWVMGQVESNTETRIFGALHENQGLIVYRWKNGVTGILLTGAKSSIGCIHRIIGTEGIIEVLTERKYRIFDRHGHNGDEVEVPQGDRSDHQLSAADVIRQLDEPGYVSTLNISNAIRANELYFAAYYSSMHRGRVDLPLTYGGNALISMFNSGEIGPNRKTPEGVIG
jgi:predicted dehydrogenase